MIRAASPLLVRVKEKQMRVQAEHDQILILDLMRGEEEIHYDSGEGREYVTRSRQLEDLIQSFQEDIIEINRLGCVLKDIKRGLLDFFHIKGKELVYLCWQLGEDRIRFWHDIDEGFEDRKEL